MAAAIGISEAALVFLAANDSFAFVSLIIHEIAVSCYPQVRSDSTCSRNRKSSSHCRPILCVANCLAASVVLFCVCVESLVLCCVRFGGKGFATLPCESTAKWDSDSHACVCVCVHGAEQNRKPSVTVVCSLHFTGEIPVRWTCCRWPPIPGEAPVRWFHYSNSISVLSLGEVRVRCSGEVVKIRC